MFSLKTWDGKLSKGAHSEESSERCVMEVVAYIAGEEHSDRPKCASPVIAAFLRNWNDNIESDARRTELLGQFVFRLPGTAAGVKTEQRRAWMCLDWLIRECGPAFMELTEELRPHADRLRELPEFTDAAALEQSREIRSAADSAARSAADSAARSAADSAADSAAYSAAYSAADSAARSAADSAAYSAADSAARSAARSAAGAALTITVRRLQESAVDLVNRMIRLTEPQEYVDGNSSKLRRVAGVLGNPPPF